MNQLNFEDSVMNQTTMGERIAIRRKDKHLTQQQLADQLGVTNKAVSKWETDEGCPDIKTIPSLCKVLDITADELLSGVSTPAPAPLTFWAWCEKHCSAIWFCIFGASIGAVLGILAYNHNWLS